MGQTRVSTRPELVSDPPPDEPIHESAAEAVVEAARAMRTGSHAIKRLLKVNCADSLDFDGICEADFLEFTAGMVAQLLEDQAHELRRWFQPAFDKVGE